MVIQFCHLYKEIYAHPFVSDII